MGLSDAIYSAQSGMSFATRWATNTSANIANAENDSYTRRITESLAGSSPGVVGISTWRATDVATDTLYRAELGSTARQEAIAGGLAGYTSVLGDAETADSILSRLTGFRVSMTALAAAPAESALHISAASDAGLLADSLNAASRAADDALAQARGAIGTDVQTANRLLGDLAALNGQLQDAAADSDRALILQDQMREALDGLAEVIDFDVVTGSGGQVGLVTPGGTELLVEDQAATLAFDAASGTLRAGGIDITPDRAGARGISEGRLSGRIALFNEVLPGVQAQLDQVAAALVREFEAADPSLAGGQAGLFTDAGAAFDPAAIDGLAGRIALNDAVDPTAGGETWRMRDGMGATAPGDGSDTSTILAFIDRMDSAASFDADVGLGSAATLTDYLSNMTAAQQTIRAQAEQRAQDSADATSALQGLRSSISGVNVDDELQQLVALQQSYNANAQVLSIVRGMLDTLIDTL